MNNVNLKADEMIDLIENANTNKDDALNYFEFKELVVNFIP